MLIHISTDFVFDGRKKTPYDESDPVHPLSVYGKSKANGEKEIIQRLDKYVIIRTSWLYGLYGNNFVKTMIRLVNEKTDIDVVSDQIGSPTAAADLAEAIESIVKQTDRDDDNISGIYHYCGLGSVSWYEFANTIFHIAKKYLHRSTPILHLVTTPQYASKAKRPGYSVLNCAKISDMFHIRNKPWKLSLAAVIDDILVDPKHLFP